MRMLATSDEQREANHSSDWHICALKSASHGKGVAEAGCTSMMEDVMELVMERSNAGRLANGEGSRS